MHADRAARICIIGEAHAPSAVQVVAEAFNDARVPALSAMKW